MAKATQMDKLVSFTKGGYKIIAKFNKDWGDEYEYLVKVGKTGKSPVSFCYTFPHKTTLKNSFDGIKNAANVLWAFKGPNRDIYQIYFQIESNAKTHLDDTTIASKDNIKIHWKDGYDNMIEFSVFNRLYGKLKA